VGLTTSTADNRCCHRCAAAGQRGTAERTAAPHWDPAYRMCPPCAAAVEILLTETDTQPRPDGADGFTFPEHPAHTGAPHFLWCPEIRGFVAQVADHAAAVGASASPGAPAGLSPRAGEPQNVLRPLSASPLVSSPPAKPVVLPAPHPRPGGDR
jgi:hypothetical protein